MSKWFCGADAGAPCAFIRTTLSRSCFIGIAEAEAWDEVGRWSLAGDRSSRGDPTSDEGEANVRSSMKVVSRPCVAVAAAVVGAGAVVVVVVVGLLG